MKSASRDSPGSPMRSPNREQGSPGSAAGQSAMLDVKTGRKRAESDLQLLANRIALLKAEEHKALHKVQETKQRSQEIMEMKRRNEELLQKKIQKNRERERELAEARARAQREREERQRKLLQSRSSAIESKRAIAGTEREQARRLEQMAQQGKQQSQEEKRRKAEAARKNRQDVLHRRDTEKTDKERQAQMIYTQRMTEEAQRKKDAEEMIALLEKEERDLINRLKKTQELQEKAYMTLQKSLES